MKIRQGFVSNSSSSSFVVYIPVTLEWEELLLKNEDFDWDEYAGDYEPDTELVDYGEDEEAFNEVALTQLRNECQEMFNELKQGNIVWSENGDYQSASYNALAELLSDYDIVDDEINGGSDDGKIIPVNVDKVKNLVYGL